MTKYFLYGSLILGLSALAVGWTIAGFWPVGLAVSILVPLSLFLVNRKFRPTLGLALTLTVLAAATGLWARVNLSLALTAVVCVLAAWDLDGFSRRLAFACVEDNPLLIERRHLMQVNLVLLLTVGIILLSQTIRFTFGFEWVLVLAILAFFGIGALVNGMRNVEA